MEASLMRVLRRLAYWFRLRSNQDDLMEELALASVFPRDGKSAGP